jgi:hypothetical protein
MTLRGAPEQNLSAVRRIPIQSPRDQHQPYRNAREASGRTEGSPKYGDRKAAGSHTRAK